MATVFLLPWRYGGDSGPPDAQWRPHRGGPRCAATSASRSRRTVSSASAMTWCSPSNVSISEFTEAASSCDARASRRGKRSRSSSSW